KASSLVYTQSLPWRHWVTILASYVEIDPDPIPAGVGGRFNSQGDNIQLSARYGIPLDGKDNRQREMDFGFDWKSNSNELEFGGIPIPVVGNRTEIFQFSLGYKETIQHQRGVTQFDIRGVWSPG